MESGDPVGRLLAALRASRNPMTRMRVLARAWRALRQLDPGQRKLLAAEVGAEGAEELLEQIADRRSGAKPALVLQALERLRGADPAELVRVVESLRHPDGRRELLERGLDAVRSTPEPAAEERLEPAQEAPARAIPISPEAPEPRGPEPPLAPPPEPAGRPRPPRPEPRRPDPPPPAEPKPTPSRKPAPAPAVETSRLFARIEGEASLVLRLARLRDALAELRNWPVERIGELIELFPEGWPRRRALSAIYEAGLPEDRHGAVFLLERLDSPISRRWCLRALLRRPGWSEREAAMLVERHGRFGVAPLRDDPTATVSPH